MTTVQTLTQAGALTAGADLWILPDLDQSHWCHKIDWYLNFRLIKSSRHKKLTIPEELLDISNYWDFPLEDYNVEHKNHLLVSSSHFLPNRFVVQVRFDGDLRDWAKEIVQIWKSLNQPSSRLFLPDQIDLDELQTHFETMDGPEHITVLKNEA